MSRLASVQEQLLEIDGLVAAMERRISTGDIRPSVAVSIRSMEKERRRLQQEFAEAASRVDLDVYRYRILHEGARSLSGLTDAWREFQNLLTAVYNAVRVPPPVNKAVRPKSKGKTDQFAERQLELGFGYSFAGSLGVALTLPNREDGLFPDGAIERATDEIFALARAYRDHDKVTAVARQLGPGPVQAMHRWAAVHVQRGYGVGIEWRREIGDEAHELRVTLQPEELRELEIELSRTTIEVRLEVTGTLTAVDTDKKTFRMRLDDTSDVDGSYDTAITAEHAAEIPARYSAVFLKRTQVIVVGDIAERVSYFLSELQRLSS